MGAAADQVAGEDRRTVLLVEDDALLRVSAADHLRGKGYHVIEAGTVIEAATVLSSGPPVHLVFSDVDLPGATGGLSLAVWINTYHEALRLREGSRPDRQGDCRGGSSETRLTGNLERPAYFRLCIGLKDNYNTDIVADLRSHSPC